MRGETDRDCRANGGATAFKKQARKNVEREARGSHPKNEPDGSLSRGSGPIFKAEGGAVIDRADGGIVARLKGGRVKKQLGGAAISGSGKAPSMGRAGRKRGGGVGADLHPKTHEGGTGPKGRKIMADSEKIP
jgi:hypothetical protein